MPIPTPEEVLSFWYTKPMSKHWFNSTPQIDQLIRDEFEDLWRNAQSGALDSWRDNAQGCLALILLFDQFPLNMFRGTLESFKTESRSIELSLHGIERAYDKELQHSQLIFFYMPLMHSELSEHQSLSVEKFEEAGLKGNARFAKHHRSIIERFGRFPHRNKILGRVSTQAEIDYLNSNNAFTG